MESCSSSQGLMKDLGEDKWVMSVRYDKQRMALDQVAADIYEMLGNDQAYNPNEIDKVDCCANAEQHTSAACPKCRNCWQEETGCMHVARKGADHRPCWRGCFYQQLKKGKGMLQVVEGALGAGQEIEQDMAKHLRTRIIKLELQKGSIQGYEVWLTDKAVEMLKAEGFRVRELGLKAKAAGDFRESLSHLWYAAFQGDAAEVIRLMACGEDTDHRNVQGVTPLSIAALEGHEAVVSALVAARANIDLGSNDDWTPMDSAAHKGHEAVVSALVAARANVDLGNNGGVTPMKVAAQGGHEAVVSALVAARASIDLGSNEDCTPMNSAAHKGHEAVLSALVAARANVDLASNGGWTPMNSAAHKGHEAVVSALVAARANVDLANNGGWTPMKVAAQEGHEAVVSALVAARANG